MKIVVRPLVGGWRENPSPEIFKTLEIDPESPVIDLGNESSYDEQLRKWIEISNKAGIADIIARPRL